MRKNKADQTVEGMCALLALRTREKRISSLGQHPTVLRFHKKDEM